MSYIVYQATSRSFSASHSSSYGTVTASVTVTCSASGAVTYSATNSQSVSTSNTPKVGYLLQINGNTLYNGYYGSSGSYTVYCKYNVFPRAGGSNLSTSTSGSAGSTSASSFNVTVGVGSGTSSTSNSSNTFYRNYYYVYGVSFNLNGGTRTGGGATYQEVASGGSVTPPTVTRTGYTFAGWNGSYTNVTSDRTLTAQWTPNSYNLSIDPNGGYRVSDGSTAVITVSKTYGSTETISERARTNYTLSGYTVTNTSSGSTTDLGGASFTFDDSTKTGTFTQGTVACTLTANWVLDGYTITFENNGGTEGPSTQLVNANETATLTVQTPKRYGYTFRGWDTSPDAVSPVYLPGDNITLTENITLYAIWDIWTYTVSFSSNGGTGSVPSSLFLMGTDTGIIGSEIPDCKNAIFVGWNTYADGSGQMYQSGDVFSSPQDGGTIYLYAMYLNTDIYFYKNGTVECIEFIEDPAVLYPQFRKNGRIVAAAFIEHDGNIMIEKGTIYARNFVEKSDGYIRGEAVGAVDVNNTYIADDENRVLVGYL